MKKFILLLLIGAIGLQAAAQMQKTKEITPLTPKEVSERLLPQFAPLAFAPVSTITYESILASRKAENALPIPKLTNADSVDVTYTKIPGLNAGDPEIPVRIYKSKRLAKAPMYIYFHGGGFVFGNLNWDHQTCANTAEKAGVVVISVDYRLAPENVFPAALNDGYATLLWSAKHAEEIGGDSLRIAVGGASAGAGIAGGLTQMARDKHGPKIRLQVLEIPPADLDTSRVSIREFYNIPGVKGADVTVLMKFYLGKNWGKSLPDYLLPGLAKNLKGLPPTLIVTCGVDPLRDGGLNYAKRLMDAGIMVESHNYAGYAHGMPVPDYDIMLYRMINQFLK